MEISELGLKLYKCKACALSPCTPWVLEKRLLNVKFKDEPALAGAHCPRARRNAAKTRKGELLQLQGQGEPRRAPAAEAQAGAPDFSSPGSVRAARAGPDQEPRGVGRRRPRVQALHNHCPPVPLSQRQERSGSTAAVHTQSLAALAPQPPASPACPPPSCRR